MTDWTAFDWMARLTAMQKKGFGLTASDSDPAMDSGSTAIVSRDSDWTGPTTDSGWKVSGPRPPL